MGRDRLLLNLIYIGAGLLMGISMAEPIQWPGVLIAACVGAYAFRRDMDAPDASP